MENINFGNYLYQLRKENNLMQKFIAYQLDVSDKVISSEKITRRENKSKT